MLGGQNKGYGDDEEEDGLKFSPVEGGGSGNSLLSGADGRMRNSALGQMAAANQVGITYIAGTIAPADMLQFQKILFRVSKGKCMTLFGTDKFEITDAEEITTERLVYLLIF